MVFNSNPYYNPEDCGLELLDSVDTAGSYEFDIFAIWKELDDNTIWWDSDSGCSCPTPFENGSHDLTQVTLEGNSFKVFEDALNGHYNMNKGDARNMRKKVKGYLKGL